MGIIWCSLPDRLSFSVLHVGSSSLFPSESLWNYGPHRELVALRGREAATCGQISVHRVGLEPMIPVFEREKTFHALDHEATLIRSNEYSIWPFFLQCSKERSLLQFR